MTQFLIPPIIYFFGFYSGFNAVAMTEVLKYLLGYVIIFSVLKVIKLFV